MTAKYKILVTDMNEFNSGWIHGTWMDLRAKDIHDQIERVLQKSPNKDAKEWVICDYEGFGDLDIPPCTSIEWVRKVAAFLDEFPDIGEVLLDYFDMSLENATIAAIDQDQGIYDELADYIKEVVDEVDAIPERYKPYIDYKTMAQDMEQKGEILCIRTKDKIYVFLPFEPV